MSRVFVFVLASMVSVCVAPNVFGQDVASAAVEAITTPLEGVTDFAVNGPTSLFRISVSTISGGTIGKPIIEGSARLYRTENITTVNEEGDPTIGAIARNYIFRARGRGIVKITIKNTIPQSPDPVVDTFNVTIR